jgi:hypothetical protein
MIEKMCELYNIIVRSYNTQGEAGHYLRFGFSERILKTGLDFYPGPFLFCGNKAKENQKALSNN